MEWFFLQGPLPITIFVAEDVLERKYSNGGVYGTSFVASAVSEFSSIITVIIHEKHMKVLQKEKSFIVMKFVTLQDGTLKIGVQSVVSLNLRILHDYCKDVGDTLLHLKLMFWH